ncbi:MAG: branched-chain amino acid transaminase [Anaerolineae bacterium]|nr:branched-chain amino acid transaminase [Thermoflexales bacterium]MDW8408653.1 branched-chain amino acid transaminase [Anaerolineae bacterium]
MADAKYIWMDGQLVEWDKATVHVKTHALHYGSSVFEGLRAYPSADGPKVLFLKEHIRRLFRSAKAYRMELPYTEEALCEAVKQVVRENGHQSCYIRPIAFRGDEALGVNPRRCSVRTAIFTMEWGAYLGAEAIEKGVDVGVSSWRRTVPGVGMPLGKIGGQYVNSQMMVMEALDHGYSEAIALDIAGHVSEGSGENIFVILDGVIYTPPMAGSILLGITRAGVMQIARSLGYEVREQNIPRELLYMADEIFFTGTAAEVTPVRSVDKMPIGSGSRGPITERIQSMFFDIVNSRVEDRWGWLTPVK